MAPVAFCATSESMTRRKRRHAHDRAWHDARMAEGPRIDHWDLRTWSDLRRLAQKLCQRFDALPHEDRIAYAFPNPEDRR